MARVTSLGALTASIAHEVNQPLAGIITNASTCLRMLAADPPNIDGARKPHSEPFAMATVRPMWSPDCARFQQEGYHVDPVDLNEATREVITLLRSELQRNRVALREELGDDLPPVNGDRIQLQQVILNLIRNASDAMSGINDRPRPMLIRTERDEGDGVRLSVQDVGVGFDLQDAERLFDAFYSTKSSGMGIGLSVCRSIIESHRGRLWAAPNNGPGATFSFSISRQTESAKGARGPDAIWAPAATDRPHVLRISLVAVRPLVTVVDDDESVREILPDLLKEFGFAVETRRRKRSSRPKVSVSQPSLWINARALRAQKHHRRQRKRWELDAPRTMISIHISSAMNLSLRAAAAQGRDRSTHAKRGVEGDSQSRIAERFD